MAEMLAGAGEKSAAFGEAFEKVANERGLDFYDAADGIHLTEAEHGLLGEALVEEVRRVLGH